MHQLSLSTLFETSPGSLRFQLFPATLTTNIFKVPFVNREVGKEAFSYKATSDWITLQLFKDTLQNSVVTVPVIELLLIVQFIGVFFCDHQLCGHLLIVNIDV